MEVLFCFDKNYEQHFGVALTSLLLNNTNTQINIHIITDIISEQLRQKLDNLSKSYQCSFYFYTIDDLDKLKNLKVSCHISRATYYRLLVADIIPDHIDKILYLDSDLVVRTSLEELYNLDIDDYFLAAEGSRKNHYFNGGVLLINLKKWREEKMSQKLIDWAEANSENLVHWDQSVLNSVIGSDFITIKKTWNFQVNLDAKKIKKNDDKINIDNANIVHFIGSSKPWYLWILDNRKKIYWDYLNKSLWSMSKLEMILGQIEYFKKLVLRKFVGTNK